MKGLRHCTPQGIWRLARSCTIMNRETSQRAPWKCNGEQVELWDEMYRHPWLMWLKPRKVGISLAGAFALLLETEAADHVGNRMRSVFAIDQDSKALEHLERLADFCDQLELTCRVRRSAPYSVVFPHGSHVDCLTMGSDEPGRGGDIHRAQITELPFAAHPERAYHAIRSAMTDQAPLLIETTITTTCPFTVALWRGMRRDPTSKKVEAVSPELHRHVSFVADQKSYRLPMVERAA